jgi:hypothetical protein
MYRFLIVFLFLVSGCASYTGVIIGKYERDAGGFGYVSGAYTSGIHHASYQRGYHRRRFCLELEVLDTSYNRRYEAVVVSEERYYLSVPGDTIQFNSMEVLK